ncbi:hypothetical protein KIN20_027210 [Parelaphostrongylus tenuis]|uniref:Uncharacterized protein n=1 Tax=Parelaphostrongylus tenuis TaxID=148309 RepID=A0AAD5WDK0_PARTN|nr:hypothetical protein KIN20_027210 [Parelaphostrongylus tenuis]
MELKALPPVAGQAKPLAVCSATETVDPLLLTWKVRQQSIDGKSRAKGTTIDRENDKRLTTIREASDDRFGMRLLAACLAKSLWPRIPRRADSLLQFIVDRCCPSDPL